MRVAFISTVHGHGWPGSEFLWGETAGELLDHGHEVFARCSADFRNSKVLQGLIGKGLCYDPVEPTFSRLARLMSRFLNPLSKLRAWNPELVVVSAGSAFDISYSPPLARFLLESGIPFIPICHFNAETFWVDESSRSLMQKIYEKAVSSVFVSADNHRITERQLAQRISNFEVIKPPLSVKLEAPLPWPRGDCWNFACVARLESRWKGQDVLFEVLARPEWRTRNWYLNLYGKGVEEGYLWNLAKHFGIADRVNFIGFVEDRTQIWRDNHIQLFPTRGEGGPMVLTEGMACGRVAVITDCGNAREYVEDGVDGFLSEFATPEIFAAALERAWVRRSEWHAMGIQAHEKILRLSLNENPSDLLIEMIHKHYEKYS
jgi:glycosyltransferase involved in cell wall biosynthesis